MGSMARADIWTSSAMAGGVLAVVGRVAEGESVVANPFTIEIFATSGDPQGIRIIQKSNWSGVAIVFPKELTKEVIKDEYADRPGVYVLVGDLAEETVYIGEADPVATRLKQHLGKDWSWGVFFADSHGLGKTEIQYLESELVRIASDNKTAIIMNKNIPTPPNMTKQGKAAANVFLSEMLLIFPLIGVRAFSKPKAVSAAQPEDANEQEGVAPEWDTIVVPAREEGFRSVFLGKNCWYAVRIGQKHIPKLKYIAAYQVAPVSAITHVAEVAEITPYQNSGKMMLKFKSAAKELEKPVRLREGKVGSQPQSARYTSKEKLFKAEFVDQLW